MVPKVDIRRTRGGLRLLVNWPNTDRWDLRLTYERVDELITSIRNNQCCAVQAEPGIIITYQPSAPENDSGCDITGDCREISLDVPWARVLGDRLRAHMPDRMRPLRESTVPYYSRLITSRADAPAPMPAV